MIPWRSDWSIGAVSELFTRMLTVRLSSFSSLRYESFSSVVLRYLGSAYHYTKTTKHSESSVRPLTSEHRSNRSLISISLISSIYPSPTTQRCYLTTHYPVAKCDATYLTTMARSPQTAIIYETNALFLSAWYS